MAKRNGGIIGPSNVPTGAYGGTAKGVWRLRDAFNYIKAGLWPVAGNYPVANSLRFNSGSTDNLTRTPASAGNRTTWTWSGWVKRSILGSVRILFSAGASGANDTTLYFGNSDDKLIFFNRISSSVTGYLETNQLFRDVSAWYHIVAVWNSNNATAGDRMRLYVNGSEITSFASDTNPSLNENSNWNNTVAHGIGNESGGSSSVNYGGYLSEVNFIDGQALTPSSFGLTDSATGIWIPKPYYGTYGTNGFYQKYANSAALGTDSSGNGNTFTANNLTSVDQSTDTPTNNFSTLNPLANNEVPNGNTFSYPDGALNFKGSAGTDTSQMMTVGTQAVSTGKWYWEAKLISVGSDIPGIGILNTEANFNVQNAYPHNSSVSAYGYTYMSDGQKANNNTAAAYGNSYTTGDIIGVALDMINNKLYFSKNGTFQNSGDPTSGATGTGAAYTVQSALTYFPACNLRFYPSAGEWSFNFGSPSFTISSGNADGAGFGNFEYAVPSGYYALCTKNLAEFG
jgi:hypothetical protein